MLNLLTNPVVLIGLVCVGIFIWIPVSGILSVRRNMHYMLDGKLYEDYCREHQGHCGNGKVSCFKCGGNSISVKTLRLYMGNTINQHFCRNCGEFLFSNGTGKWVDKLIANQKSKNSQDNRSCDFINEL